VHILINSDSTSSGSGKSYIASALVKLLNSQKYMYNAAQVSLDDFYLGHHERALRRERNPGNELFKVRGQPGTHDADLALEFFEQLCSNGESGKERLWIPSFDKSLFQGDGDRLPRSQWPSVNGPLDILVFEGWCLGFQALPEDELISAATTKATGQQQILPTKTLADHQLEDLLLVNKCLRHYNDTFLGSQHFNFMVHLDTDDLANVYKWRLEQERELWRTKGTGMSDFQVVEFGTC
jgi:D-glycerate 3-kinase